MATKLSIYNDALRAIGELRLATITDDIEARYVLDDAWQDCKDLIFTEGLWNFATITQEILDDPLLTPIPGYSFGFNKPTNWIRTVAVSTSALFHDEAAYRDENGFIYSNWDRLYIRFISGAKSVDGSIGTWPPSFARLAAVCLAEKCARRISGSNEKAADLEAAYKDALATAKNKDALDQAQMTLRPGNWVRAMRGTSSNRDRGPLSGF